MTADTLREVQVEHYMIDGPTGAGRSAVLVYILCTVTMMLMLATQRDCA